MKIIIAMLLAASIYAQSVPAPVNLTITGSIDASGASTSKPVKTGTSDPGTCGAGELLFRTDATAGQNLKGCTSTNTWTLLGGAGSFTSSSTDTLTNKTYDTAGTGNSFSINGLAATANTGTGSVVRATSPTITTPTIASFTNATHDHSNAAGGGNLGASALSANAVTVAKVAAILATRQIGFMMGAETGSALADTDDQPGIFANRLGQGIHITEVWCQSDAGSPTIQIQKDDGSPTNMLSSNLTCSTGGASTTTFVSGEDAVASAEKLNFLIVAASTAKRITVMIKYTLD